MDEGRADREQGPARLTRRQFLTYSGAAVGSVAVLGVSGCAPPRPTIPLPPFKTRTLTLRRRLDMVSLRFDFYNLRLSGPVGAKQLVRQSPLQAAYVVVHFPPQSVLEQAIPEDANGNPSFLAEFGTLETRLGHESRLAFVVPQEVDGIPYTSAGLLAWADYALRVAPHALPDGVRFLRGDQRPAPRAPTATETAIELPWWLIISPNRYGRFLNAGGPVTHGVDRTELWHTRLAVTTGDEIDEHREHPRRTGRAIWTADPELPDYLNGNTDVPQPEDGATLGQPFLAPMAIRDRVDLLSNSADFRPNDYLPEPFRLNNLMLSALGGWLDATGAWPEGITSLISWRHRATQGRDHYVRIVRKGYYLPTGHPAAQVQISERKFERRNGISAAYLQHRTFLITRRPVKEYPGFHQQAGGRSLPFRSIRLTTLVTPTSTNAWGRSVG